MNHDIVFAGRRHGKALLTKVDAVHGFQEYYHILPDDKKKQLLFLDKLKNQKNLARQAND